MDINFGCFYRFGDSPRVFKCVGMCAPFDFVGGKDFVLVSEVKPNGNSGILTYIPIEDFLEQFEQLGN